ncbi:unnamed protein product [Ilex paraguariensis]|uniref:UBA domain-containing protein n=1 Tax=Ilex paraguariensis TaxID=185542 RepID=A0ABC8U5N6_9AQUA
MDYDFRNRTGPPYDSQAPMYNRQTTNSSSSHPMYGQPSLYPKIGGQSGGHSVNPIAARTPSFHPTSSPSSSSGTGIRVAIKQEYRIKPPPQLSPHIGDIPRSSFQFDFELERKILAEAETDSPNWSRLGLENFPSKPAASTSTASTSTLGSTADPIVSKYIAAGLSREAVPHAVANYGDNPTKVREFVNAYTSLREMGFPSNRVAEALLMYDNDRDKAVAHFLNNLS